ncbi:MAG: hypothetical protein Q8P67_14180 [archaeon]|nr:hypothetical protein [archaeon]
MDSGLITTVMSPRAVKGLARRGDSGFNSLEKMPFLGAFGSSENSASPPSGWGGLRGGILPAILQIASINQQKTEKKKKEEKRRNQNNNKQFFWAFLFSKNKIKEHDFFFTKLIELRADSCLFMFTK